MIYANTTDRTVSQSLPKDVQLCCYFKGNGVCLEDLGLPQRRGNSYKKLHNVNKCPTMLCFQFHLRTADNENGRQEPRKTRPPTSGRSLSRSP